MAHSFIADSIWFPCPSCGADRGQYCSEVPGAYLSSYPDTDTPWCHSNRIRIMQYNPEHLTILNPL